MAPLMNFALIGPTCAGKSTLSTLLIDAFDLKHVSPGLLMRESREKKTILGILTRRYIDRGDLVPDEVISAIIEEAVCHTPPRQGLVFDGFPSTEYQAQFLDELLERYKRKLDAAIYLPLPDTVVFERAAKRIPARKDDRPQILRYRQRVFARTTGPMLKRYADSGRLAVVRANPPVDKVYQDLFPVVSELAAGRMLPPLGKRDSRLLANLFNKKPVTLTGGRSGLNLVILGGPGSGKGTHAQFLCQNLGIPHISTGDIFRANIAKKTELGKIAQNYMNRGELVPDHITEAMVQERLAQPDATTGFLFDGFPRTLPQTQALDEILMELQRLLDGVIYLNVPDDEIVYRIGGRSVCPVCHTSYHEEYKKPIKPGICDTDGATLFQRDDDNPETIRARLKSFHAQTEPLIDQYRQRGLLMEVSGIGSVDEVRERMQATIKQWQSQMATAA
jgi:adenylate kinase